ncbi:MAG: NYN domain-containing protein [Acidobacteria bacterium]|nr:NYN domain-containing protein [Acidobacteriota bacterium]
MYLIDGNNVIGQRGKGYESWFSDKPAARRQLLNDLARLARVKKLRLTVVFDGAPDGAFPDGSSFRGVKVLYARQNSDADTRIVELAEAERNKKSLTVVTSDGKLTARVRVCGVRVIRSGEFRQMLEDAVDTAGGNDRIIAEEETDEWLRYFGVDDSDDD